MWLYLVLAAEIVGFWKTVDDDKVQSIMGIYEHEGKCYGRIVATYNDEGWIKDHMGNPWQKAEGVEGNPHYCGLDILWNLTPAGEKWTEGKIMDPEKGRIYDAEAWREGENLIMRGEIKILGHSIGRNGTWPPAADADFPSHFPKPDLVSFVPKIPEPLKRVKDSGSDH